MLPAGKLDAEELIGYINKPLLLHLVGCLYYRLWNVKNNRFTALHMACCSEHKAIFLKLKLSPSSVLQRQRRALSSSISNFSPKDEQRPSLRYAAISSHFQAMEEVLKPNNPPM